ncbi:MAG: hypothetical protein QM775_01355 [Pirellulales bacterium]
MWVLGRGGQPRIRRADGESKTVSGVEDLPTEPFFVTEFKIGGTQKPITDDEWRALGELRAVEGVQLAGCRPTDEALKALGRCKSLQYLVLAFHDSFGDEGVKHLVELPRLAHLDLCNSGVTAASLEHLAKITSLRSLQLGFLKNAQVTSLKPLGTLVNLENLGLNNTVVADAAVGDLAALPRLRFLNIADTRCTSAVIDELLKLRKLCVLSLRGVHVSAESLRKLADHPTLSVVGTYGAGIKLEEYESLRPAAADYDRAPGLAGFLCRRAGRVRLGKHRRHDVRLRRFAALAVGRVVAGNESEPADGGRLRQPAPLGESQKPQRATGHQRQHD